MLLDVLIILIIAIKPVLSNGKDVDAYSTPPPCGQYGFRCVDHIRYQICPFRDSEGTTEEPDVIHECKEGFLCDEDNPAYCTPVDNRFTTIAFEASEIEDYDTPSANEDIDNFYPEIDILAREPRADCGCNQETTTTEEPPSTTETEYFTTMSPQVEPFDCDHYGFFADFENRSLFWYCDVPPSGEGYLLRHMVCGADRTFDPYKHACVLPGTVRDTRTNLEDAKKCKTCLSPSCDKFTCRGKAPGKYADDTDCQLYHVCLTKNFAPVRELLFSCPENTAFDPTTNKCSRLATKRCMNKSGAMEQVINKVSPKCGGCISCKTPSRFRDLRDCGGYYLCYGDQLLEMRCPEFYKFDDNILECLPEGIARCDEEDD